MFRRGPSKQVLLIRWQRGDDSFFPGQWFKGRIYEHRCDLSPSGEKLLYFAADHKPPFHSWTAISRPPFFTALALWPKGDCWGGGGQFKNERAVLLNHLPDHQSRLAEGFTLPKAYTVAPFGPYAGRGEDSPIFEETSMRDGWTLVQPGRAVRHGSRSLISWTFDPPEIWSKPNPRTKSLQLRTLQTGIHRRDGAWRIMEGEIVQSGVVVRRLGEVDWIDWDSDGDLLHGQGGCLFRSRLKGKNLGEPKLILDTNAYRFRPLAPSDAAKTWHLPLRLDESSSIAK